MRKRIALIAAMVLALGVGAGIAYASIPGPDGVIHGCYKTSNPGQGGLIAIDSAATCPSGFTALNWNQTGPQGAPGVSGYGFVSRSYTGPFASGPINFSVDCPTGKSVLWGGGVSVPAKAMVELDVSLDGNGKAFRSIIGFDNTAGDLTQVTATAICATVN